MWDDQKARRLGAAIRRRRAEQGLSQEALAYQAGITKNQLQLIEAGKSSGRKDALGPSNLRLATLSGIVAILKTTVAELLAEARV